jgi:hypothetical protein
VVKKKDGSFVPSSILFTANAQNLDPNTPFSWYKNNSSTAIDGETSNSYSINLTATNPFSNNQLIIKVARDGLEDTTTVILLDEAKNDAISVTLTNPSMTFNTTNSNAEYTEVRAYLGTTLLINDASQNYYYESDCTETKTGFSKETTGTNG